MPKFAKETPLSWFTAILGSSAVVLGAILAMFLLTHQNHAGQQTAHDEKTYSPEMPQELKARALATAPSTSSHSQDSRHLETNMRKPQPQDTSHPTRWGYSGNSGPSHWDQLGSEWEICRDGRRQSPINFSYLNGGSTREPVHVHYLASDIRLQNDGHTIRAQVQKGSFIKVAGQRYDLEQFHFHTPSEHTIEGRQAAAEVHLLHRSESGDLAVIGLMLDYGIENELLSRLWEYMPTSVGHKHKFSTVDFEQLLPESRAYYSYTGSLTKPPCTEGVRWMVMKEPIQASRQQLTFLRKIMGPTARPVQILHGRTPIVRGIAEIDALAH